MGWVQAMSAMVQLELPHVNVLTKVDLLADENKARPFSAVPPSHALLLLLWSCSPSWRCCCTHHACCLTHARPSKGLSSS
jgi:hypothetical protein